jgi:hypothetical protein
MTRDGWSLEEHWNAGNVRAALATREWDVLVLQQGPSSLPESRVHLREWSARFAALARAAGTRPALLGVWPESSRRSALGASIASYEDAARAARADLYPAAAAWRAAWSCNRRLALYGPDGLHPSELGTYVAALAVYGRLLHAPLLSPKLVDEHTPPRVSRLLQAAAATSLGRRIAPRSRCGSR